ncbi:two-component system, sensor histidine kinase [Janthinobacterium sp. CG_23.3]|uniref:ATP-binding response regulator n=1 Tax=Janthinobacterium sp. CG_23.3 TaxID=3349634 RepID=UPI0038D46744
MSPPTFPDSVILNVDDSDGARYAKSRILTRAGFQVIEAANGGDALLRARAARPNLILLDVKLPDINGFEVCRRLKSDPDTQAILVLQTSASYIGVADKIRALDGGADNYLFEPIEPEELVANVKALLRLGNVERELREVDRRKDEFLATLAHELRNPLGPIRNAVELLQRLDPDVPEWQRKARQTIRRHTDHMVRLVDDLLDVSRISQGKITRHQERVELHTVIDSALESNAHIVASRRHALTLDLPAQPLWLPGDYVRLSQIVGNLLHNAAKFTAPGGAIALSARLDGGQVLIRVADNGVGLAPDRIDFIFGLFAQDRHANDRVQDALGIGLSLVRKLVTLHGGSVGASSAGPGRGSVFEVRLPAEVAPADAPLADPAPAPGAPLAARILVVDDNEDAADTLADLLEIDGHQVRTAYNCGQAIDCARSFRPQYVFLDIGLPDLSGYEVAVKLRELPDMRDATLIALTGYGRQQDKDQAFDAGFDKHVVKPIDFAKLATLNLHSQG